MSPQAVNPGAVPSSRWACIVRASYGVALICSPGRLIELRTGCRPSSRARAVGRVLGARHLAQAVICGVFPTRWLVGAGAAADAAHCASMLTLAGADAGLRPALLTDAAIAGGFAAAGEAFLHGSRRQPR